MTQLFNPKVSVMIITYNQEDLISETIESVMAQAYENLEIVVADDASKDRTPAIILDYAKRFPGKVVPVLNPVNLGITGNCNSALFACTGEFIAILGGDDLFSPGKISKQVQLFSDSEVVLSYHPVEIFLHQTGEQLFVSNLTAHEDLHDAYEIISKGGIPGASSVMIRRSAAPKEGFNPRLPVVSDWLFYIEVAMVGKVAKLDGVYGKYRKHGKGASDRTFELLDESLMTLKIIQEKYPNDEKLKIACRDGAYRYLLGELFRQVVKGDKDKIKFLRKLLVENSKGMKQFGIKFLYPVMLNSFNLMIAGKILPNLKSYLKRRI